MSRSFAFVAFSFLALCSCTLFFGKGNGIYFDTHSKNVIANHTIRRLTVDVENGELYSFELRDHRKGSDTINIEKLPAGYVVNRIDYKNYSQTTDQPFKIRPNIRFTIQHHSNGDAASCSLTYDVDSSGTIIRSGY